MTVIEIILRYLLENVFDGLHNHAENQNLGGCCCTIKDYANKGCQEGNICFSCEPAYKHTKTECKKCPDYTKCEAYQYGEQVMLCGKKNAHRRK